MFSDELLITCTIGGYLLLGLTVQQMEMGPVYIDVVDKMLVKEGAIAVRALARQPDQFIEAEEPDAREIEVSRAVEIHEVPVQFGRGPARGQA